MLDIFAQIITQHEACIWRTEESIGESVQYCGCKETSELDRGHQARNSECSGKRGKFKATIICSIFGSSNALRNVFKWDYQRC